MSKPCGRWENTLAFTCVQFKPPAFQKEIKQHSELSVTGLGWGMDKNKLLQGKEGCELTTDSSHTVTAHVASHRKLFSGKGKLVWFF